MIKRVITKSALLKRLQELEKVVSSNEPFIVFIEQVDEDCFKVTTQVSKGKQKVEIETYEVSSLDEFYKLNPGINCPVIYDDMEFSDEDETIMFNTLVKLVNQSELDVLVDLMVKTIETAENKPLDDYLQKLIKKYHHTILETVGFNDVDYTRLSIDQLKRLAFACESDE